MVALPGCIWVVDCAAARVLDGGKCVCYCSASRVLLLLLTGVYVM